MLKKEILRLMAAAERMMDEGTMPFVFAPSPNGGYERFAVSKDIMEDLDLKQGQHINTMIMDGIIELQLEHLKDKIEKAAQQVEDSFLDPDFDFRKEIKE